MYFQCTVPLTVCFWKCHYDVRRKCYTGTSQQDVVICPNDKGRSDSFLDMLSGSRDPEFSLTNQDVHYTGTYIEVSLFRRESNI